MKYPAFNEYQAALQHPARCLKLRELKHCIAETDLWGLPRVRSGGFALTYKLADETTTWALRCFHKHVLDREERYASINKFIIKAGVDYLEPIQYKQDGIVIKGTSYPVTFMKWVEGETLESYVIRHLDQQAVLEQLTQNFISLVTDLEKRMITHGDLSHHNIMLRDAKLVLVDYDGMNVPEMKQSLSCEIGNPQFQHPGRDETIFDLTTDRFSSIVLYLALKTLTIDPKIWYHYETGGEGLLFRRADFEHPFQSPLLQEMETIASLTRDVQQFRQVCLMDVRQVPRLEDFINGLEIDFKDGVADSINTVPNKTVVLDSNKKYLFSSRLGEIVTVVGKVEEVFSGYSRDQVPHIFLNFGNWKLKCFTVVLWDESLNLMQTIGIDPEEYQDKWVSVTGMLTSFKRRPQIIVNTPFDVEILDEERAALKISSSSPFWFVRKSFVQPQPVIKKMQPQTKQKMDNDIIEEKTVIDQTDEKIANPLDISTAIVDRITDLYRNQKTTQMTSTRKKKQRK